MIPEQSASLLCFQLNDTTHANISIHEAEEFGVADHEQHVIFLGSR